MTNVEQFFKDYLDNKIARVSVGCLNIEGTLEEDVIIEYRPYFGLILYGNISYNEGDVYKKLSRVLIDNRGDLTYDQRDKVLDLIKSTLGVMKIKLAHLYPYSVKKVEAYYDDKGTICSVNLLHKDGSIIRINSIKENKNE